MPHTAPAPPHPHATATHWLQTLASAATNLSRKGSESSLGSASAEDKGADDEDDVAMSTVSELKTTHDKASISQVTAAERCYIIDVVER